MIKAQIDIHLERKLTHIFGVLLMVVVHHFAPPIVTWALLLGFGIPLIVFDIARKKSKKLHDLTPKLFGRIMRRRELNGFAGTTFLLAGAILIFAFFPRDIVSLSLLFLALADPIASYVGLRFGTHKILGKKTFEGTLAAFVVCTVISLFYFHFKNLMVGHWIVVSFLGGLIGSMTELLPLGGLDDNFTQPVLNAILLYALFLLFGGFN